VVTRRDVIRPPSRRAAGTAALTAAVTAAMTAALLAACAGPSDAARAANPIGTLPMFDATGRPVDRSALLAQLRNARFVLLGEVHDNPAHHAARAELLRALLADGRPTQVVFEQIDREGNAAIAVLPPAQARDADAVAGAGQLDREGWAWPLHRPVFAAALAGGATVRGGNLSRADANQLVRGGAAKMPADLQRWFDPARAEAAWSKAQDDAMRRDVDEGHCKAMPAPMLAPMALAQRARDAALADAMLQAPTGTRVVLIAGNGHVRSGLGVPHYLRSAGIPAGQIATVGYLERPAADGPPAADERADYDFSATAAPVQRADPCDAFKPKPKPAP